MAGGGLFDPLGTDRPARASRGAPSPWLIALLVVLIGIAVLFGLAAFRNGGAGGNPRVVAAIGAVHHTDPVPPPPLNPANTAAQAPSMPSGAAAMSDQEVEIENGVRVIRPRRNGSPVTGLVMKVPDPASVSPVASPADNELLEPGPSGLLPRVGADGRRPAEVYAGAAVPGSTGKPWISIVVSSLGNASGAAQAPADWPAGVTLGFAVDGTDLVRQVASARATGHEVVLMLPPRAAGTPRAAITPSGATSASPAGDRLRWPLSRFTGYAGVVMDSTNLDRATAATDILEMTRRGLYVVDAPPSRRVTAPTPSVHAAVSPAATVDVTLTESAGSETPDTFLDRLTSLARSDGSAIGIAPATPRSLAAISRFVSTLTDTGVALVPLGAVVNLRQSSQARPIPVAAP